MTAVGTRREPWPVGDESPGATQDVGPAQTQEATAGWLWVGDRSPPPASGPLMGVQQRNKLKDPTGNTAKPRVGEAHTTC